MGTDIHGVWQAKKKGKWVDVPSKYEQDRDYMLFAWLGNVRNGHGFAGVKTHTPIVPLSDNRGFPEDFVVEDECYTVSNRQTVGPRRSKYFEEDNRFSMGDHSFTWVSGDEIVNGTKPSVWETGILSITDFQKWDGKTHPQNYSGGIFGSGIRVAESPIEVGEETTHVRCFWKSEVGEELNYFIEEAKRLIVEHGEIRFVFGFDS